MVSNVNICDYVFNLKKLKTDSVHAIYLTSGFHDHIMVLERVDPLCLSSGVSDFSKHLDAFLCRLI